MPKKAQTTKQKTTRKVKSVEEQIQDLGAVEEKEKIVPPQVMQVVEVTDEQNSASTSDEIKENVQTEETEVVKEEQEETTSEIKNTEDEVQVSQEKQKEVVSEFFSPKSENTVGYPNISIHKKSISPVILWAIAVCVIVVVIGVGIITLSKGKFPITFAKPTPTPTQAPMPTVTPTPAVDKKTISIEVLNGSGVAGVASKMKNILEEKGYTVTGTGNAKTYDYDKTEIQTKERVASYSALIQADLTGSYVIGTTSSSLKSSLPYDVIVIIGKE